jgi:hypothetical protein
MKKLLFLMFLVAAPIVLLAQDSLGIEVPEDVWEVLGDPNKWLGTLVAIAGVSVLLTQTVVRLWGAEWKKWVKQVISWALGIVLALLANAINIGFLAEETWLMTVLTGLGVGLVSNGIFDAAFVKAILEFIGLKLPKK